MPTSIPVWRGSARSAARYAAMETAGSASGMSPVMGRR